MEKQRAEVRSEITDGAAGDICDLSSHFCVLPINHSPSVA